VFLEVRVSEPSKLSSLPCPRNEQQTGMGIKTGIATLDGPRGMNGLKGGWRGWCVEKGKNVGENE